MPTVNNRRLLPLNGVLPIEGGGAPGDDDDDPKKPPNEEVPQEKADPSDESSDESESEASDDESSSSAETTDDDPELWNKPTLVQSIKYAYKMHDKLKLRFQSCLDQIERLNNDKTNLKIKNQTSLASKNTTISNLRNQLKTQAESKLAVRATYDNKYREEIELLKSKNTQLRKQSQDLKREVNQLDKDGRRACTEKDLAKRKLTDLRLDFCGEDKGGNGAQE